MDLTRIDAEPQLLAEVIDRLRTIISSTAAEEIAERKSMLSCMGNSWRTMLAFQVLSQLDTVDLIGICKRRETSWRNQSNPAEYAWQAALNAKALNGTADDVIKIRDAAREQGFGVNLNTALSYASKKYTPLQGIEAGCNFGTTETLLRLGANPNNDEGSPYVTAVASCGIEMGRVFARNGLDKSIMQRQMRNAVGRKELYDDLREIYWSYARYSVPDPETLVEVKQLDDGNTTQMRVIFNFAAGRVSEMIEWPGAKVIHTPVVRDFFFEDYGTAAIDNAREKLIELGGHPSDGTRTIRKARSPLNPKD